MRAIRLAMANCVFRGNDCLGGESRHPEFYKMDDSNPPMFINSIVWHSAADYVPFKFEDAETERKLGVASCDIRSYVPPVAGAAGSGFQYMPILDQEPLFASGLKIIGNRRACLLSWQNDYSIRKRAKKVCRAVDGSFYFLDTVQVPNVWRKVACITSGNILTLEEGAAIGLSPAAATYPDVFGAPRRSHASMGPVDAPPLGLAILID